MFKKRLKQLRKAKGLSQKKLGELIIPPCTQQTIWNYENGNSEPNYATLSSFATFFGVSTDYLLGNTDDPRPVEEIKKEFDLDAPFQEKNLTDALCKISELVWEFDLDDETIKGLIKKVVTKYGPPDLVGPERTAKS
jgi:transcriptional regulator with XRE-family HTH domain